MLAKGSADFRRMTDFGEGIWEGLDSRTFTTIIYFCYQIFLSKYD